MICATRINVVFFIVFTGACLGFVLAAAARWCVADGRLALAGRLVVVSWQHVSVKVRFANLLLRVLALHGSRYQF